MFAVLLVDSDQDTDRDNSGPIDGEKCLHPSLADALDQPLDLQDPRNTKPRGFLNQRNNCFLNAVLQALFAFGEFRAVLQRLNFIVEYLDVAVTPVCLALHILYQQWLAEDLPNMTSWKSSPLYPESLEDIITRFSENIIGRHEDAHEFFHYLIDTMHEEFAKIRSGGNGSSANSEDLGFTAVSNKRNRRRPVIIDFPDTLISRLFGGRIRSSVEKQGCRVNKGSSQFVPFYSLQLPLDPYESQSLVNLILAFSKKSWITGVRKGNHEVNAHQISKIHKLPSVLTLQLKRFTFNGSGVNKVHQHVSYPEKLSFPEDACTDTLRSSGPHMYTLRAIICHVGQNPTHGHYTAYIRYNEYGWIFANDNSINQVKWADVRDQQAYILFYELNRPS